MQQSTYENSSVTANSGKQLIWYYNCTSLLHVPIGTLMHLLRHLMQLTYMLTQNSGFKAHIMEHVGMWCADMTVNGEVGLILV